MNEDFDVYRTLTPFGTVDALFGEAPGVTLQGPDDAVEHVKRVMRQSCDSQGMTMTVDGVEPRDYFYFCQPEGSGIMIIPPADVRFNDQQPSAAVLDGVREDVAALQSELAAADNAKAKLAIAMKIIARRDVPDPPIKAAKATKAQGLAALAALNPFMGNSQTKAVRSNMNGEEGQYFIDKMIELATLIKNMPVTHGQDGKGDQAIAYLHYFRGGMDWWITEKDVGDDSDDDGQHQAFGAADIGYGPSLGYISIQELIDNGVELDFHFPPKTLAAIKGKGAKDETKPPPGPDPLDAMQAGLDFLQSFIDGTADIMADDALDKMEAVLAANPTDKATIQKFEAAANAYSDAMVKLAQSALQG